VRSACVVVFAVGDKETRPSAYYHLVLEKSSFVFFLIRNLACTFFCSSCLSLGY
jgi:hypothetical protein